MEVKENTEFPYEIRDVEPKLNAELMKHFTGNRSGYVHVGPHSYHLPKKYEQEASKIYNMKIKSSDVFVCTYARSGTTLTQDIVWLLKNDLDFEKAIETPIGKRFPFLEVGIFFDQLTVEFLIEKNKLDTAQQSLLLKMAESRVEMVQNLPSPRLIKSHLPLSLLPPSLLDTAKVVYVARDPRDVAVSFYHHNKLIGTHSYVGDFKTYWNYFMKGLIYYAPFFEHLKEAWEGRHHPNMLFLFYEDLVKDMPACLSRIASFLDKKLDESQMERLCNHVHIDNFRNNKSVNLQQAIALVGNPDEAKFIRKGKSGGWRDYFDAEMTQQAERWIADNLRGTDLRFPHVENQ